jgi:hypothetical protein
MQQEDMLYSCAFFSNRVLSAESFQDRYFQLVMSLVPKFPFKILGYFKTQHLFLLRISDRAPRLTSQKVYFLLLYCNFNSQ